MLIGNEKIKGRRVTADQSCVKSGMAIRSAIKHFSPFSFRSPFLALRIRDTMVLLLRAEHAHVQKQCRRQSEVEDEQGEGRRERKKKKTCDSDDGAARERDRARASVFWSRVGGAMCACVQ